ncbi:MAG TPA: ABC transporter ATP-binding protein [Anaerolineaceae bacterium]|nr:ABC transporter ATP-binding protein [Anaerolineaceae bacterium]
MEIIDKAVTQTNQNKYSMPPKSAFLRLDNLSKSFMEGGQKRVVLRNVSLELYRSEVIAILGKSGSGKTTLLNLIGGIEPAESGEVYVEGFQISALKDHERTLFRRTKIGFIFQFFNLIPTLTVWENVVLPLELNRLLDSQGKARAFEMLQEVGLADRLKTFPDRLSGGEQQRVAIARALVHDPILVLADEPTGNLDEETGRQVLGLLDRLTRKTGKSLLMVTHSLDAAAIADRVFDLRDAKLVKRSS